MTKQSLDQFAKPVTQEEWYKRISKNGRMEKTKC